MHLGLILGGKWRQWREDFEVGHFVARFAHNLHISCLHCVAHFRSEVAHILFSFVQVDTFLEPDAEERGAFLRREREYRDVFHLDIFGRDDTGHVIMCQVGDLAALEPPLVLLVLLLLLALVPLVLVLSLPPLLPQSSPRCLVHRWHHLTHLAPPAGGRSDRAVCAAC